MKKLVFILLLLPVVVEAQLSKQDSVWLPFKSFIGKWTGESQGQQR